MSLVNYHPLFGIRQLQDDINRLFSDWNSTDSSGVTADWVPSVDINEFEDKFQLYVDIPGVDPKDIGAIYIGAESHPYAVKPSGTIVAEDPQQTAPLHQEPHP